MPSIDSKEKTILIAPLDWGLGHATRCIPLISELCHLGCHVLIGAEGQQAALLHQEFPDILILPLQGYRIKYNHGNKGYALKIARQLPRISRVIRREKEWLKQIVLDYQVDAVISDNRFGLHYPEIPSVIMTHQLHLKSPFSDLIEKNLQKLNYYFLQKFNACWVVDFDGSENLAGDLSHPEVLPAMELQYLGALSRFEFHSGEPLKYDLLVLISGPEPQRSIFEKMILDQIRQPAIKAIIVGGKPESPFDHQITENIRHVNHLDSKELNKVFLQSELIISRSGYTTVMDLIKLRKKAILVPTPGQTEQEYLGNYLMKKKYFLTIKQQGFRLSEALQEADHFKFCLPEVSMEEYHDVLKGFIDQL